MTISIIRKADIVAAVPDRWARQYRDTRYEHHAGITERLAALKGTPFTAAQCDEIIGNTGWTRNDCDECGADHEILIRIGDEPDYEARWVDICASCLAAATAKASAA